MRPAARSPAAALLCALLGAGACRPRVPTYHQDIAPIFAQHCRGCHHTGGVAPVPTLNDYASAKSYAQPIRFAVQTRRMPPWGVDDTGLCGSWEGSRWLSTEEIATIAKWHESGAPEGKPAPLPAPAAPSTPFRADATLDTGGVYQPGLGAGGYRCFISDPKLDRDRLLSAIRVTSSDPRAVAQVTLFALDSPAAEADAAALDAADATLGYSCYGTTRVRDSRLIDSWTWPDPVLRMPAGTGARLHSGRKIVVQIHYDIQMSGNAAAASTRVDLELDDHAREARVLPVEAQGSLAPGQKYVAVEGSRIVERKLRVVGVAPRMHIRGQTLHLTVARNGERPDAPGPSTCLASFDHWHFSNQQLFRARKPAVLEPHDRVAVSCSYNTLGRDQPMEFGDGIDDEECVAYLFVTDVE